MENGPATGQRQGRPGAHAPGACGILR
jgi:hypothetical protein